MEWIVLNKIKEIDIGKGTRIEYEYSCPPLFDKFVKGGESLFVEFPEKLKGVPQAILTIPFVGIMSTVAILLNIGLQVPELDKNFYNSLQDVEHVFNKMYPKAKLRIQVNYDKLVDCAYDGCKNSSLFFTGGVDATSALAEIKNTSPTLINIWGGDIRLTDEASHVELECYLEKLTKYLGLEYRFIKTNAREMFEENALGFLCEKCGHKNNHGWWASVAHIISMVSTISPWVWKNAISTHYIGSSYDGKTKVFDSNNAELISALKYSSCSFQMVDEFVGRNEKVDKIIEYKNETKAPIELKVCWQRIAGKNCSDCEKCYRTIMNIIVNRENPNNYGFVVDTETIKRIKYFLENNTVSAAFWKPICSKFNEEREFWCNIQEMSWVLDVRINSFRVYKKRIWQKMFNKRY